MKNQKSETNTSKPFLWMAGILLVIVLLTIGLAVLAKNMSDQGQVLTYEDCIKQQGSLLQETYPEVCVTSSGQRFINPVQLKGCKRADFATNHQSCK